MKTISKFSFMSTRLLVLTFILMISGTMLVQGQERAERIERIKAQRSAFLTVRMSLTPEEAQKFWPVWNEFHEKRQELIKEFRSRWPRNLDVSKLSDREAEQFAEYQVIHIETSARLTREFHEALKKILSPKKIALLYEAEEEFNRRLVRERIQRGQN